MEQRLTAGLRRPLEEYYGTEGMDRILAVIVRFLSRITRKTGAIPMRQKKTKTGLNTSR
jgi:hypothetical protein